MGEGILHILGLITNLAVPRDRIFIIEEPENDLHPSALKSMLDLIIARSAQNQFIITTHSNIVLKKLGAAAGAKVFRIGTRHTGSVPAGVVEEIPPTPLARREILEELGYDVSDYDLWKGWLILEESSAEKIIREHLIRWFAPSLLGRLRTYSARSLSSVEPRFKEFNELFVFLHLQQSYVNRAWVVVDGGEQESQTIASLRSLYGPTWDPDQFRQFKQHDFESYYPPDFESEVRDALATGDKAGRRTKKKWLLDRVENWIREDDARAQNAFLQSAADVIDILREIERKLS